MKLYLDCFTFCARRKTILIHLPHLNINMYILLLCYLYSMILPCFARFSFKQTSLFLFLSKFTLCIQLPRVYIFDYSHYNYFIPTFLAFQSNAHILRFIHRYIHLMFILHRHFSWLVHSILSESILLEKYYKVQIKRNIYRDDNLWFCRLCGGYRDFGFDFINISICIHY